MAAAGIVFGSHSLTHARLTRCNAEQLRAEVMDSKKMIEDQIGRSVNHFCYPYGDFDQRIQQMVQEAGYHTACTTEKGVVLPGTNPWRLPRLAVGKRMRLERFLLRLALRH
jgi:peptidoglycan/xylan/chitin deacetylase (PgdA/CDA1 family)